MDISALWIVQKLKGGILGGPQMKNIREITFINCIAENIHHNEL